MHGVCNQAPFSVPEHSATVSAVRWVVWVGPDGCVMSHATGDSLVDAAHHRRHAGHVGLGLAAVGGGLARWQVGRVGHVSAHHHHALGDARLVGPGGVGHGEGGAPVGQVTGQANVLPCWFQQQQWQQRQQKQGCMLISIGSGYQTGARSLLLVPAAAAAAVAAETEI